MKIGACSHVLGFVCSGAKTHSEQTYGGMILAFYTEVDSECNLNFEHWSGPDNTANAWFIRDLGCYQRVTRIFLRNSYNSDFKDR